MPDEKNKPITEKEEIAENPDHKIDQDFEGYPHGPAKDETIKPKTKQQHKTADSEKKDGEKMNIKPGERKSLDQQ
jgi:hypothetical protein